MLQTKNLFLAICVLNAVWISCLAAQSPPPKLGYLRFWDMLPPANGAFELCKAGAGAEASSVLSGTAYRYSSYTEFPAGRYKFEVYKKGDRTKPLKTLDVDLRPQTFFTIIVGPKAGTIDVELVADTNDPKVTSGMLIIRNYFPGLTVSVTAEGQALADRMVYGQSNSVASLPLKRLPIVLRTTLPNGTPAESEAEADFQASNRATLLIIPDSYGRFRPRVTIDGKEL